ncbi:MAG: hypothetical protein U0802_23195 [Candidatus Binatia bacterium]
MSGDPFFAQVAEDTLRYVERDLLSPDGACWSAEDADSVPASQVGTRQAPAPPRARSTSGRATRSSKRWVPTAAPGTAPGVQPGGNAPFDPQGEFGTGNLFYTARTIAAIAEQTGETPAAIGAALARGRQRLFAVRSQRPRPALDDKVLTAWNGLMLAAFARAARVLEPDGVLDDAVAGTGARHLATAVRVAQYLRHHLWDASRRRLWRRHSAGAAGVEAFAEDYACVAWGLIELFQATGDAAWLAWALDLHAVLDEQFLAPNDRGWYATTGEDPSVLLRQIEAYDGAEPSATSVAVTNLLTLARLTGRADLQERAEAVLAAQRGGLAAAPRVRPHLLAALSTLRQPAVEVVVVEGEPRGLAARLRQTIASRFMPGGVVVPIQAEQAKALAALAPWTTTYGADRPAAAFACRRFVCAAPITSEEALAVWLDEVTHPGAPEPPSTTH